MVCVESTYFREHIEDFDEGNKYFFENFLLYFVAKNNVTSGFFDFDQKF